MLVQISILIMPLLNDLFELLELNVTCFASLLTPDYLFITRCQVIPSGYILNNHCDWLHLITFGYFLLHLVTSGSLF